jgi:hypothetical protein
MPYLQLSGYVNCYCLCYGETLREGGTMFQGAKLFLSMGAYWLSEAERPISPSASHLFRPLQFVGPGSSFYPLQQVQATGSTGNSSNWAWEIIRYTVVKGRAWQIQQKLPAQAGYCLTQALFPMQLDFNSGARLYT